TSIVVSGTESSLKKVRNILHNEAPRRARVDSVIEFDRNQPILLAYQEYSSRISSANLRNDLEKIKKENKKLQKELNKKTKDLTSIENSLSWKITKPFRRKKKK